MPNETISYAVAESPVGPLLLAGSDDGLCAVRFQRAEKYRGPEPEWRENEAPFRNAIAQLGEYFAGSREEFDLRLAPEGTEFQRGVWDALLTIPYGQTASYGELARRIGNPAASRAVGAANGQNPLPIIVPCHRIVGANGQLAGFGGGIAIKEALLDHERRHSEQSGVQLALPKRMA